MYTWSRADNMENSSALWFQVCERNACWVFTRANSVIMANSLNQIMPDITRQENNLVTPQVFSEALRHEPIILNEWVKYKNRVQSSLADSQWMAELPACWHREFWLGQKFKLSSEPLLKPTCVLPRAGHGGTWVQAGQWWPGCCPRAVWQDCVHFVPCLWTLGAHPAARGAAPAARGAPSPGGRSAPHTGTSGRSSAPPAPSSAPPGSCSSASTPHFPLSAALLYLVEQERVQPYLCAEFAQWTLECFTRSLKYSEILKMLSYKGKSGRQYGHFSF